MEKGKIKKFSTINNKIKKIIFYAAVIYTVVVLFNQQRTLSKINDEIDSYTKKVESITIENEEYRENIDRLHDLEYIESIARKELGLIRENEKVYIFPKE